jgi:xylan 1,4-beta-xylosidase
MLVIVLICIIFSPCNVFSSTSLSINTTDVSPFPHYWENCIGSGHALLTLRQDWRDQLKQAHQDIGFNFVRFHGLLDDDMSTCMGPGSYSYFNIDSSFDYLISVGVKPLVELSFMPEALASGNDTVFHYKGNTTPPKNFQDWYNLIGALAKHLVERYGEQEVDSWYFEVWNEPDIAFWSGTQTQYFQLYSYTARALKSVSTGIRVGGPVSAIVGDGWIPDFIGYCKSTATPIDFISTHSYGGTATNYGDVTALVKVFTEAKDYADSISVPLIISEYGNSYEANSFVLDEAATAAFVIAIIDKMASVLPEVFSYWTFSDIFEEQGFQTVNQTFYGGFGLQNVNGIPKPAYRAFELLHKSGATKANYKITSDDNCNNTFGIIPLLDTFSSSIMLFLYNHSPGGSSITDCYIDIIIGPLHNPKHSGSLATVTRIDNQFANPKGEWIKQGMPQYPNLVQIQAMFKASQLNPSPLDQYSVDPSSFTK